MPSSVRDNLNICDVALSKLIEVEEVTSMGGGRYRGLDGLKPLIPFALVYKLCTMEPRREGCRALMQ